MKGRKFKKNGNSYIVTFNKRNLIGITPGEDVAFTVTAIVEHKGRRVAFGGGATT